MIDDELYLALASFRALLLSGFNTLGSAFMAVAISYQARPNCLVHVHVHISHVVCECTSGLGFYIKWTITGIAAMASLSYLQNSKIWSA